MIQIPRRTLILVRATSSDSHPARCKDGGNIWKMLEYVILMLKLVAKSTLFLVSLMVTEVHDWLIQGFKYPDS